MALIETLAARLGAAAVLTEAGDMAGHLVEARGLYTGEALAVVRPRDRDEVAFVLRECASAGVPVVPQGGNTGLVGGGVPYGGIVLSLGRLDRIREVDPVNATITVEAGCILKSVQDAAEQAGYLFPLSLASEGSCRIGGNLATNAGGTAVLKLFPKPQARVTAFIGCASAGDALKLFERLRAAAGDQLTAFEYMPPFGLDIVLKHSLGAVRPLAGFHGAYALIELSTPERDADLQGRLETILGEAFEEGLVEDAAIGASEAQAGALWQLGGRLSEGQRPEGGPIQHGVAVPVSRVAEFIDGATQACEAEMPGLRVC